MNYSCISGRVTKDIELRKTKDGKSSIRFTVAVNRRTKDAGADFIPCAAFGKTADLICRFAQRKGSRVCLEGHWQSGNYVDKAGKTVYTLELIVDRYEAIDFGEVATKEGIAEEPQQPIQSSMDESMNEYGTGFPF